MNWSRAKTVLIILFLCTDIFLLATYFTSKYSSSVISDDVVESTISVLAKNGIMVETSVIPKKIPDIPYTEAENVITDYESFAKTFLGDSLWPIEFGYESKRGKITFYGDRFNFVANTEIYALADIMTIPDEKAAKEYVVTDLGKLGFDLKNAKISVAKSENGFSVSLNNNANSLPVFNSEVQVTISNHIITSISGIWFNETLSQDGNSSGLKSITSALIDFIPQAPQNTKITKLELGYNIFDKESYHKSATLIPVWKVTCQDGATYLLDARNM